MMVIWSYWGKSSNTEVEEAGGLDINIGFLRDGEARDFLER